jgi:hypothetical protein
MDVNLKTSLKWFSFAAILTALWILYGCTAPQRFHKIITVSAEIHIVADREQFDSPCPSGTAAYFYKNPEGKNVIFILGNQDGLKYRTRALWLGHEIQHALSYDDNSILDPHDYKFWMDE